MKIDLGQIVEDAIVGMTVRGLIDEGYKVKAIHGGPRIVLIVEEDTDENKQVGVVSLIRGNGADVVHDYTTTLGSVMADVQAFADIFR